MDLFRIAARVAAKAPDPEYKSFGKEPNIPNKEYESAYTKLAKRYEDEANKAGAEAGEDPAKNKECVKLYLKAEKMWSDSGHKYQPQARAMRDLAKKHDQKLKSLTGETFGIR